MPTGRTTLAGVTGGRSPRSHCCWYWAQRRGYAKTKPLEGAPTILPRCRPQHQRRPSLGDDHRRPFPSPFCYRLFLPLPLPLRALPLPCSCLRLRSLKPPGIGDVVSPPRRASLVHHPRLHQAFGHGFLLLWGVKLRSPHRGRGPRGCGKTGLVAPPPARLSATTRTCASFRRSRRRKSSCRGPRAAGIPSPPPPRLRSTELRPRVISAAAALPGERKGKNPTRTRKAEMSRRRDLLVLSVAAGLAAVEPAHASRRTTGA